MIHETGLIATVTAGVGLAFLLGMGAVNLRLPPLLGYLWAGVVVAPFVADVQLAQRLAEIGVVLLMFGVGVHFSLGDLVSVQRIALPGALAQVAAATALGAGVAQLWGWSWGEGIVFGLCLSVASTVVLLRTLENHALLGSIDGRVAVGWLGVEVLVTVFVLVLLPALAHPLGGQSEAAAGAGDTGALLREISFTLAKMSAFMVLMLVVGRRAVPWLVERVARTASRELFTLSVLAVALGIALGASAMLGVSFALAAFFGGMVVNGSHLSQKAAAQALPLRDAFSVPFFVAVGMLFDPSILLERPLEILAVVLTIMVGRSVAAFVIVLALRYRIDTALMISASLAQIGEFSFILAALAVALGLLRAEAQSLIVAGALISITLNPLAFGLSRRLARWMNARPRLLALFERPAGLVRHTLESN